jgi:hypothetical protein
MAECKKHPGIWTIRQIRDDTGEYGYWCPGCRQFCEDCPEHQPQSDQPTANLAPPKNK